MNATTFNPKRSHANCRMWLIRNYFHDLTEFYSGDEARFTRMVIDGGKSLETANSSGWAQHIINCTIDAIEFYSEELTLIYKQLQVWGHNVSLPQEKQEGEQL